MSLQAAIVSANNEREEANIWPSLNAREGRAGSSTYLLANQHVRKCGANCRNAPRRIESIELVGIEGVLVSE